jgi:uncharacterized protein
VTKERLQKLSLPSLLRIAANEGIKEAKELPREELVELILEAMAEERLEREQSNNEAVRIGEKKYDIIQDEELEAQEKRTYCIPDKYPETRIHLLLRDPFWAFAYWEIKDSDLIDLKKKRLRGLVLRVHMVKPSDSYDIPVKISDSKWYINLPESGREYYIELVGKVNGSEKILCASNRVRSPKKTIVESFSEENISEVSDSTLVLTGILGLEGPSGSEQIPQRIIQFINANNFNFKS